MSALLQSAALSWLRSSPLRRYGWIGVDVGTAQTKLAQVERTGDGYRMLACWSLPSPPGNLLLEGNEQVDTSGQLLEPLRDARKLFRGRTAAAAVSASVMPHRSLELPTGASDELRHMVEDEFAGEGNLAGDARCLGIWRTPGGTPSNAALAQVSVLSIAREVALNLAGNLCRTGLECRVLDGLPCALARAVRLADPAAAEAPVAMIDIGQTAVVFVIAVDGQPRFTRILRGGALETLLSALQTGLRLSPAEADHLLGRMGAPPADAASPQEPAAQAIYQLLDAPVAKLLEEIKRTLQFLHDTNLSLLPQRILLCGGGSCLPHLPNRITSETGYMTERWSMPTAAPHSMLQNDSLFAVAAALSALAWEARPCT